MEFPGNWGRTWGGGWQICEAMLRAPGRWQGVANGWGWETARRCWNSQAGRLRYFDAPAGVGDDDGNVLCDC
jgi:hypothetical protein